MRRPISRVLSVTETNIIFIIPTPPTSSEIMATHKRRLVIKVVVEERALLISVMSRIRKSSACPERMRWRSRNTAVICRMAAEISPVPRADTMI